MEYIYLLRLSPFLGNFSSRSARRSFAFPSRERKNFGKMNLSGGGGGVVSERESGTLAIATSRDSVLGPFQSKYD